MAGETSSVRRFDVDFKKTPGTLSVTSTHIAWVPKEAGAMDRQNQAMERAINMLASKAGSKAVSLKVLFRDDIPSGGLHLTFSNLSTREEDRKAVQDILIPFVAANKNPQGASNPTSNAVSSSSSANANGSSSTNQIVPPSTSAAQAVLQAKGKRKLDDVAAEDVAGGSGIASPGTPGTSSPGGGGTTLSPAARAQRKREYKLRQKVLEKNPTLRMLHRELVIGKQITEEEFWDGREALIQAEEMAYAQKPGRASRLLDDRFDLDAGRKGKGTGGTGVGIKQNDNGPIILKLSKELTREIFEEFPVVQDAYAKYVPGISETEFWSRYFTSQLWERHRASVRKSAVDESTRKKDDIFDQYLEEPDWNIQPRQTLPDDVERFLDLAATEEDHGESITVRDVTMQAGRERSALPLIRRFNDHSKKLLRANDANRDQSMLTDSLYGSGIDLYNEIDLADLHGPAQDNTITLDVQEAGDMADKHGQEGAGGVLPGKSDEEIRSIASKSTAILSNFEPDFQAVCLPNPGFHLLNPDGTPSEQVNPAHEAFSEQRDAQAAAYYVIKDLHTRANAEVAINSPFPEQLHEQMRSCHNAATEFLRQYWSAILPSQSQSGTLGHSSVQAKENKAIKMAGYLKLTENKVKAIIETSVIMGFDPERAMAPTVGAVKVALAREAKRRKKA
uniref:Transcription initiation factor TFIIH subunit 1 n=1 Tax=Kwoniella dejecticola CBS 10117 TaxID=1296121 RepID=A0A1A6A4X5_9TREE|nr:transcription initiation factor TFIIH subunit 1 [Kwoniella dejecticola CBS 10117]OBR85114.1 transcription initiation factor TFIIH subunit 1 [Kwoniella dejecticola CBS 10117]